MRPKYNGLKITTAESLLHEAIVMLAFARIGIDNHSHVATQSALSLISEFMKNMSNVSGDEMLTDLVTRIEHYQSTRAANPYKDDTSERED